MISNLNIHIPSTKHFGAPPDAGYLPNPFFIEIDDPFCVVASEETLQSSQW